MTGEGADDTCTLARDTVLHMSPDGDAVLGGPAPAGTAHSVTGFVDRVGDPAGVVVDEGAAYRAEDLVATAVFCMVDIAREHLDGPSAFCVSHPADWSPTAVADLREALDYLGLRSVDCTPDVGDDPAAAAARSAYRSVVATPAGVTPPDRTDNTLSDYTTEELPVVAAAPALIQAYSAAPPVSELTTATFADTPAAASPNTVPAARPKAPLLAAAATLALLALGGGGAAIILQNAGSAESEAPVATAPPINPTTVAPVEPIAPIALPAEPPATIAPATPVVAPIEPVYTPEPAPAPAPVVTTTVAPPPPPPSTTTAPAPVTTTTVPTTTAPAPVTTTAPQTAYAPYPPYTMTYVQQYNQQYYTQWSIPPWSIPPWHPRR
ncbi:hypothetical protein [Skermania piniformis]|uniref:Uncharacterized protein n=2 Tax=Skermania pinensis TaxID=39122 RepID=A0ABX8S9M5_9ACTN|nr:hypothetical protein [Skermania piniformis]QXQ13684.1 hypothetical protein KV203_18100 [Skermania piniformis]